MVGGTFRWQLRSGSDGVSRARKRSGEEGWGTSRRGIERRQR